MNAGKSKVKDFKSSVAKINFGSGDQCPICML